MTAHARTGPATLWTLGHGRLDQEGIVAVLGGAGVRVLVDVRRSPGSLRHPHTNRQRMAGWLAEAGIGYRWEERLGGRREVPEPSPDPGLEEALRGYAAHLRAPEGSAALAELVAAAAREPTAVLCAEQDWRRCHRRVLADAAVLGHGVRVRHLRHDGTVEEHELHPAARWSSAGVVYDRGVDATLPGC